MLRLMCHSEPALTWDEAQGDPALEEWWRWTVQEFPEDWTDDDIEAFNSDMAERHRDQYPDEEADL